MKKLINVSEADQPLVNRHVHLTTQLNEGKNPDYAKRPGQGEAWFQPLSNRMKDADGKPFSHSEYTGQALGKCPCCHENSLYWINIEKQNRAKYEVLSLRMKAVDVEKQIAKTGSKGATEEQQADIGPDDRPKREFKKQRK